MFRGRKSTGLCPRPTIQAAEMRTGGSKSLTAAGAPEAFVTFAREFFM